MFRIESYVTPIILSYVEKYVKNIRPQDSQVSFIIQPAAEIEGLAARRDKSIKKNSFRFTIC